LFKEKRRIYVEKDDWQRSEHLKHIMHELDIYYVPNFNPLINLKRKKES
jgi:hypothetical protein